MTVLRGIIDDAVAKNASEIQLVPEEVSLRLFYRIGGIRRYIRDYNRLESHDLLALVKDSACMDLAEHKKEQFGEFQFKCASGEEIAIIAAILIDEKGSQGAAFHFVRRPF